MVPGFRAGGKTGTAYKLDPVTKRYSVDKYLSSFAGLVPIAAPRLAIVVIIDEPSAGSHYGGKVAGPAFAQIASASLRYLGVPGDAPIEPAAAPDARAAEREAEAPTAAELVELATLAEPVGDASLAAAPVPDFRGLGVARALALAAERGLAVEVHGSGRCVAQSVAPGPIPIGAAIDLEFSDRD